MSYMRDICLMCVLYYLFTYFAGIAPCMGLRVSFVLFHLSKYYIDYVYVYVYTFDYLCNVLNKIVIIKTSYTSLQVDLNRVTVIRESNCL